MDSQKTHPAPSQPSAPTRELKIIGNSTRITVAGIPNVPAKIDTGASISSIWASQIRVNSANQLEFCLFAPESEFYTGEVITASDFSARVIRNSTGQENIRYLVTLPTSIQGKRIRITYTLYDRSRNNFPVLIGRRALRKKFLVDVSRLDVPYTRNPLNKSLKAELSENPQEFHRKYMTTGSPPDNS